MRRIVGYNENMYLIEFLAFAATMVLITSYLLRFPKLGFWSLLIAAMALTPWWIYLEIHAPFMWVKLYSVVGGSLYLLWACTRSREQSNEEHFSSVLRWLMYINIAEAVAQNFVTAWSTGQSANALNALAGICVILTFPRHRFVRMSGADPRLLLSDVSWTWILGYTMWNFTFVLLEWSDYFLIQFATLAIPFCAALLKRELWPAVRAYSLAACLLIHFSLGDLDRLAIEPNLSPETRLLVASFSLALALLPNIHTILSTLLSHVPHHDKHPETVRVRSGGR